MFLPIPHLPVSGFIFSQFPAGRHPVGESHQTTDWTLHFCVCPSALNLCVCIFAMVAPSAQNAHLALVHSSRQNSNHSLGFTSNAISSLKPFWIFFLPFNIITLHLWSHVFYSNLNSTSHTGSHCFYEDHPPCSGPGGPRTAYL